MPRDLVVERRRGRLRLQGLPVGTGRAGDVVTRVVPDPMRAYEHRREADLRRLYGDRWAEVYNEQTMLKDEDHGSSQ